MSIPRFTSGQVQWALEKERRSRSKFSFLLLELAKRRKTRRIAFELSRRWEGDLFFSKTAREILKQYYGITLGAYSYAINILAGGFPPGTVIGRYCSIADGVRAFRRNHPMDSFSQHPFFYNAKLGLVSHDTIPYDTENPLVIGNDVWIGDRVTVLPKCRTIGTGSVLGAGAVITADVAKYLILCGNPARKIAQRPTVFSCSAWSEMDLHKFMETYS